MAAGDISTPEVGLTIRPSCLLRTADMADSRCSDARSVTASRASDWLLAASEYWEKQ
jgi:hypothetical protein